MAGGQGAKESGKATAKECLAQRSGRQHPRTLETCTTSHRRVGAPAAKHSAVILESLTAKVLEPAGNASKGLEEKPTTQHHLQLTIHGDEGWILLSRLPDGVISHIHKSLIGKKGQQKKLTGLF